MGHPSMEEISQDLKRGAAEFVRAAKSGVCTVFQQPLQEKLTEQSFHVFPISY